MTLTDEKGRPSVQRASESIPEVPLLKGLDDVYNLMLRTCEFFFKGMLKMNNPPFRGFILLGPPGTGKTEIVRQVARKLDERFKSVFFGMIDGASVAAPKWGEGERNLRDAFHRVSELEDKTRDAKVIILFDDIESLMISRGADMAKEWHYAINSILFHELDAVDPSRLIVCATSNRPALVDDAIKTRLYPLTVESLPVESLRPVVAEILHASGLGPKSLANTTEEIMTYLRGIKTPTIREARYYTVAECIRRGIWTV